MMELWLYYFKRTGPSLTGGDENPLRFALAHFLGEMLIYPVTIMYHGTVVHRSSL